MTENKDDLISREALRKEVTERVNYTTVDGHIAYDKMLELIDNAPTVCGNNPKWCESCVSKGKCASTRPQGNLTEAEKKICKMYLEDLDKTHTCNEYTLLMNLIDNAPTVLFPLTVKLKDNVTDEDIEVLKRLMKDYKPQLVSLETERPQGEWIPVEERLPEVMQHVLVWFEYYRYGDYNCMFPTYGFCQYVCDGKWSQFINGETGWTNAHIIAWMPLPEPYSLEVQHEDS